jgi:hypothetical protein
MPTVAPGYHNPEQLTISLNERITSVIRARLFYQADSWSRSLNATETIVLEVRPASILEKLLIPSGIANKFSILLRKMIQVGENPEPAGNDSILAAW